MRNIIDVINELYIHSTKEDFKGRLNSIKDSALYTAPEAMYIRWDSLALALSTDYPNPFENEESEKLVSTFMNITIEELREKFQ